DQALADAMRGGGATERVIITVKPGYRATLRKALQQHGHQIKAEHASLDLLVGDLDAATVQQREKDGMITALSLDGPVNAHQRSIHSTLDATSSLLSSPVVTTTLRQTLGLPAVATSSTLTASTGIGIAIVDSGIAPSADFGGRITGFYDFTNGRG